MKEGDDDESIEMIIKGLPEEHFEYLIEGELAVELHLHIFHNSINVLLPEASAGNKIGPLQLLLIECAILIFVDNFKSFNISLITAINNHLPTSYSINSVRRD